MGGKQFTGSSTNPLWKSPSQKWRSLLSHSKFPVPFCQSCDQEHLSLSQFHTGILLKHEREFSSILYQDGISLPSLVSPRRRRKRPPNISHAQGPLYKTLPTSLSSHYFTLMCPFVKRSLAKWLQHTTHGRGNLWVNKSIVLEQNSVKMKRIEVPIKKVAQTVVEKHFKELEESGVCSMDDCVFRPVMKF